MVVLYCTVAAHLARVLAAIPAHQHAVAASDWRQLHRLAADAAAAIVVLPTLGEDGLLELSTLTASSLAHWVLPVVLVTSLEAENARRLKEVTVDEVVWLSALQRELGPALQRASHRSLSPRMHLADEIRRAENIPSNLRDAIEHACRSERLVESIAELAKAAHCGRSTLGRQWRRTVGTGRGNRLEDFLDWVLLLRAVEKRKSERSWEHVADELGLYGSALSRLARRTCGCTLRELTAGGEALALKRIYGRLSVMLSLGTMSDDCI